MNIDNAMFSGRIAAIEHEIDNLSEDLEPLQKKLDIAYAYKDHLYNAMKLADDGIKNCQNEYFEKVNQIRNKVGKIQQICLEFKTSL